MTVGVNELSEGNQHVHCFQIRGGDLDVRPTIQSVLLRGLSVQVTSVPNAHFPQRVGLVATGDDL